MLAALAASEPLVLETFAEASEVLGYDLWELCQLGPEEALGSTERTQPAMLTAGVATWRVLGWDRTMFKMWFSSWMIAWAGPSKLKPATTRSS